MDRNNIKWMLQKWDGGCGVWTGLMWPRVMGGGGLL